jgi:cyanophycinase
MRRSLFAIFGTGVLSLSPSYAHKPEYGNSLRMKEQPFSAGRRQLWAMLGLLFLLCASIVGQERLVVVGGGKRPEAAMRKFVEWAGGERANILVIPWATSEPESSFEYLKKDLAALSPKSIVLAPVAPITAEKKQLFLEQLKNSTGVFFTGGDQVKTMEVLKDEALLVALREHYKTGAVYGGTSAGAAIMSTQMITGEGDFTVINGSMVQTSRGLGLLPEDIIIDQHFIKRQRQNRLFGLVLQSGQKFGVGIDEDTALLIVDNRYGEVVGSRQVMTVDPRDQNKLMIQLVKPGEWLDLKKRSLTRKRSVKPNQIDSRNTGVH